MITKLIGLSDVIEEQAYKRSGDPFYMGMSIGLILAAKVIDPDNRVINQASPAWKPYWEELQKLLEEE